MGGLCWTCRGPGCSPSERPIPARGPVWEFTAAFGPAYKCAQCPEVLYFKVGRAQLMFVRISPFLEQKQLKWYIPDLFQRR